MPPIWLHFWDVGRYWSKIANLNLPHLYLAPPLGVMSLEFRRDFWQWKTRVPGLSYGVVTVILGLDIFVQLQLVTDGQTDGSYNKTSINENQVTDATAQMRLFRFWVHHLCHLINHLNKHTQTAHLLRRSYSLLRKDFSELLTDSNVAVMDGSSTTFSWIHMSFSWCNCKENNWKKNSV